MPATPIAGDDKYGDRALNRSLARGGAVPEARFERMFLHAKGLRFAHPASGEPVDARGAAAGRLRPPARRVAGGAGGFGMTRPRRFDLIVFDWDGTLFDSTALIARCIQAACADLGTPVPSDRDASYVIGLGLNEALQHAAPRTAARALRRARPALPAPLPRATTTRSCCSTARSRCCRG